MTWYDSVAVVTVLPVLRALFGPSLARLGDVPKAGYYYQYVIYV